MVLVERLPNNVESVLMFWDMKTDCRATSFATKQSNCNNSSYGVYGTKLTGFIGDCSFGTQLSGLDNPVYPVR